MTIRAAIGTIAVCTLMFALIGGSIGWSLGTFSPSYYRTVFHRGNEPWFDPVSVGVGQGLTQGTAGGAVVGLILVALFVWRDTRMVRKSDVPSQCREGTTESSLAVVKRCIAGLLAPWLILAAGIACLMAIPDPHTVFGLWYLLLIVCMTVILVLIVARVWSLARSARLRRSAWAWGLLVGCFVNMVLLGKVGGH